MPDNRKTPQPAAGAATPEAVLGGRLQAIKASRPRALSTCLPDLGALQAARAFETRRK